VGDDLTKVGGGGFDASSNMIAYECILFLYDYGYLMHIFLSSLNILNLLNF
jgi:hypothetical protein